MVHYLDPWVFWGHLGMVCAILHLHACPSYVVAGCYKIALADLVDRLALHHHHHHHVSDYSYMVLQNGGLFLRFSYFNMFNKANFVSPCTRDPLLYSKNQLFSILISYVFCIPALHPSSMIINIK
ncbi:hypothetical protein C5167_014335 [Papaver somniferum]|uniref:Uncharacterized protein n=1 Tax=Papaver somniferum TaxID=3469 RepID=A0A4Y7J4V6_PAPSO|nr:hypothetical protein C5167_014335 [Papaver somniferum]